MREAPWRVAATAPTVDSWCGRSAAGPGAA